MKKLFIALSALFVLSSFTLLNTEWKSDPAHSQLVFTVRHLGISNVSGTFNDFTATINATKPDFSDAQFELNAKIASIDTRVEARDNHLKSADFFNAEKYPTLNFKSTKVTKAGKDKFKVTGNMTMHGITKPVTVNLEYNGSVVNAMNKKETHGFTVSGVIKRSDFNIGEKFPAPMISDEVRIHADGEFTK